MAAFVGSGSEAPTPLGCLAPAVIALAQCWEMGAGVGW